MTETTSKPAPAPDEDVLWARLGATRLARRLRRAAIARNTSEGTMLALAAGTGALTGLLTVVLIELLLLAQRLLWGPDPTWVHVLLVPAAGGLVVALIIRFVDADAAGSGVSEVMEAIALHSGRMRFTTTLAKTVGSAVSLGSGLSGGREGPMVHIGGSVGSVLGRIVALDEERKRTLIAAGTAAGIAAAFNAPIGGMLFALEVIVGGFTVRSLQVIVVAAVISSVIAREIIGDTLIYDVNEAYTLGHPQELLLYVLLGLLAVVVGRVFVVLKYAIHDRVARSAVPNWLAPVLGGLLIGPLILALPEVAGTGHELPPLPGLSPDLGREPVLHIVEGGGGVGWVAVGFLALLMVGKLVATSISLGTFAPVGSFAPTLFIGAAMGGALGHAAEALMPSADAPAPGAFALVGMAALFGATARAPLTGILIVFEISNDYGLVLPLMLATGVATWVSDRLWRESTYTWPLLRKGVQYSEPEDIDIMQTVRVGEIMTTDPETVTEDLPVVQLSERFQRSGHHGFPVLGADGRLVGIVTRHDIEGIEGEAFYTTTVGEVCTRRLSTVTPEDPVFRAVRRMAALDVGRIPVVAPDDHGRLVGLVRRSDLVTAYQRALTRSLGVQQRKDRSRLRDLADAVFVEIRVDPRAAAAGRAVREVGWPQRTVLTSIRRRGDVVMPNGSTVIEAGDEVVVLTARDRVEEVRALLAEPVADEP